MPIEDTTNSYEYKLKAAGLAEPLSTYLSDPNDPDRLAAGFVGVKTNPLTGESALSLPEGNVKIPVPNLEVNFLDQKWKTLATFNEGWGISGGGSTVLGAENSNLLSGGLKRREWTVPSGGSTLTWNVPAAKQFSLASAQTVGLLLESDAEIRGTITVYFYEGGFTNGKTLQFNIVANTPDSKMFLVAHVDRVASESPNNVALWGTSGTGSFANTTTIVQVFTSGGQEQNIKLHGIFLGGKSKTKVMIGFDMWAINSSNLYSLVFPQMAARGHLGYLAPPTREGVLTAEDYRRTKEMYDAGWDVINHSDTHQTPQELGSQAAVVKEYSDAREILVGMGYNTAKYLGAWPKNTTNAFGVRALRSLGYKWFRGLSCFYTNAFPLGINGVSHQLEAGSVDLSDRPASGNIAILRAAIREGQSINFYTHSVYKNGQLSPPNAVDPGNGAVMNNPFQNDIWESSWNLFYAEVCAQEDAGTIEVIRPSDYYMRCTGVHIPR
jgi:hypothetical protein